MAIAEIKMPTGWVPVKKSLQEVRNAVIDIIIQYNPFYENVC